MIENRGLDSHGSEDGQETLWYEHDNEPSGPINAENFLTS